MSKSDIRHDIKHDFKSDLKFDTKHDDTKNKDMKHDDRNDRINDRPYVVYKISQGTVIDHIPHWKAYKVIKILNLVGNTNLITVGFGLDSKDLGKKDILKIENKELNEKELNKIALVAKNATINIIEHSNVKKKFKVSLPDKMENLVKCVNLNCITRHEEVPSVFYSVTKDPIKIQCHYCETMINEEDIDLL